jgi:cell division protein FtsB
MPSSSPRPATRSRFRVRWDRLGRIGLLVVFLVVVGLYVQHALAYFSTKAEADQQLAIISRLTQENARLAHESQQLSDPAAIAADARALGMVKPGERPYVITGLPASGGSGSDPGDSGLVSGTGG